MKVFLTLCSTCHKQQRQLPWYRLNVSQAKTVNLHNHIITASNSGPAILCASKNIHEVYIDYHVAFQNVCRLDEDLIAMTVTSYIQKKKDTSTFNILLTKFWALVLFNSQPIKLLKKWYSIGNQWHVLPSY